jgi:hypothetical protein
MAGKISRLALCAAPGVVAMTPLRKTSPLRNAAAFCHAIPVLDITILASVVPGKCRDKMKWHGQINRSTCTARVQCGIILP